jgi:endonuclease YncB( thermonuclease family)
VRSVTGGIAALVAIACLVWVAPAAAQTLATVAAVSDGETLTARLADGQEVAVRLIGIDAPALDECGGRDAAGELEELALDQAVTLTADPAAPATDGQGRSWLYADRSDGLDVGLAMVRRGWATLLDGVDFQRLPAYVDAYEAASGGVWRECGGDFHVTRAEQERMRRDAAKAFVRRYYRRISANRFRAAWGMLGRPVRRRLRNDFDGWRAGHRGSLGVRVLAARAWSSGRRVVVRVRLRSRDRDVCDGRIVRQWFRGNVVTAPRGGSWAIVSFRIAKTGGATPRLSRSQCPPPPQRESGGGGGGGDCQGYSPCIGPGSDVDCAGGSGDGPRYVDGPVYVDGSDPYDLDRDGDGVACED